MKWTREYFKKTINTWSSYDKLTKFQLVSATLIVLLTISVLTNQYIVANNYQASGAGTSFQFFKTSQQALRNSDNIVANNTTAVYKSTTSSNNGIDNDTNSGNGNKKATASEQSTTKLEPSEDSQASILPEISEQDVRTVDFKLFKLSGKVDIVDIAGHTYIDVESLASWFGRNLGWDYENDRFICVLFGADFRGASLEEKIYINGRATQLAEPIYIIDKVPYIPAESFARNVGAEIILDGDKLEVRVRNMAKAAYTFLRS